MKTVILSLIVMSLMIGAPSVYALSDYDSGYKHGLTDGKDDCTDSCHWYILQQGKGFAFHSKEFNRGYVAGWCSVNPIMSGSDADEASFNCREGPDSASWLVFGTSAKELAIQ